MQITYKGQNTNLERESLAATTVQKLSSRYGPGFVCVGRCCEFLEDVSEDVVNSWKMYRKTYTLFGKTWQTLKQVKRIN